MATTLGNLLAHVIFGTKHRRPLIAADWQEQLYEYIGGIVRNRRGVLLTIGGMPDHVHLLMKYPPALSVADLVRDVKTNSSRWRHEAGDAGFAWQAGYGAFSVSESAVPGVVAYISNQPEHHRKQTFEEEYVLFLERNKLDYDPQYLWD